MKLKYINVYVNDVFAFRTVNYRTCKEAVDDVRRRGGMPVIGLTVLPSDSVKARFCK